MGRLLSLGNLSIGIKIASGFTIILLLFSLSIAGSFFNLDKIWSSIQLNQWAQSLADSIQETDKHQEAYLFNRKDTTLPAFKSGIENSLALISDFQSGRQLTRSELQSIVEMIKQYDAAFDKVVANTNALEDLARKMSFAFDAMSTALINEVKNPIEEKKNQALVTGEELSPYDQELLSTTDKVQALLIAAHLNEKNYLNNQDKKHAQAFKEKLALFKTAVQDWHYVIDTIGEDAFKNVIRVMDSQATVYNQKTFDHIQQLVEQNKGPIHKMNQIKEGIVNQIRIWKTNTQQGIVQAKENAKQSTLLLLVLGILFGLAVTILATRSISKVLKTITSMLQDIADGEGDLTKRLTLTTKDEIGHLATAFNVFIEKIQKMVGAIATDVGTLKSASGNLSGLSGQLSEKSVDMSSMANAIATASEEMSSDMDSVAGSMQQASVNLKDMTTSSEELTATISEIAQSSENARNFTEKAVSTSRFISGRVHELGNAALKIGTVTQTITDISQQINLLALNATIEAARAGEAGKGFAVVANEIKELAKQTDAATGEIKNQIQEIQTSTATNVKDIDEISDIVENVNEIVSTIAAAVEEQSATTRSIAGNVGETSDGIQDITYRVENSSTVSHTIYKDISNFKQTTQEMSNMSGGMNGSAEDLARLAEHLKDMVDKFKT